MHQQGRTVALTSAAVGRGGEHGNRVDVDERPRAEALAVDHEQTPVGTETMLRRPHCGQRVAAIASDPAQTQVGPAGSDSPQSAPAAGGLSDDCPSLQSTVAIPEADDGE